jgi:hypothetical protein
LFQCRAHVVQQRGSGQPKTWSHAEFALKPNRLPALFRRAMSWFAVWTVRTNVATSSARAAADERGDILGARRCGLLLGVGGHLVGYAEELVPAHRVGRRRDQLVQGCRDLRQSAVAREIVTYCA